MRTANKSMCVNWNLPEGIWLT